MFLGEYDHSLDTKGRLIIPAKFRAALGDSFIIARGMDECLNIYDTGAWEKFASKLMTSLPDNSRKKRELVRFFLSGADEVQPDRQGRILIPARLRAYAGITRDVVLAGCGDRIEVWSKEKWEADVPSEEISQMAEELLENGFEF